MKNTLRTLGVLAVLAAFGLSSTPVLAKPASKIQRGKNKYTRYCAACHGTSAKGDGMLAEALTPPPPDLTKIAERHDGFRAEEIAELIDGRRTVRAHGPATMPVWGTRFAQERTGRRAQTAEEHVERSLDLLVAYLQSIQTKAGEK